MAKSSKNAGWPGFFRLFAVLCAIMGLLARQGSSLSASVGDQRVFQVYVLLTLWAVPALFMVWGMSALEDGKSASVSGMLLGYALPTLVTLIVWGTIYAVTAHLLGGGGHAAASGATVEGPVSHAKEVILAAIHQVKYGG